MCNKCCKFSTHREEYKRENRCCGYGGYGYGGYGGYGYGGYGSYGYGYGYGGYGGYGVYGAWLPYLLYRMR